MLNMRKTGLCLVALLIIPIAYYAIVFGNSLGENFGGDTISFFETASIFELFVVVIIGIVLPSIFLFWANTKSKNNN